MSFFRWTAPVFKLASKRWSPTDFAELAGLLRPFVPPGGRLLDIGGGTGELGAGLASRLDAQAVVADTTEQMLARVDGEPRVSVSRASAERLPFPDAFFDGVLCSDAFHHFADQVQAAQEMARVLREGGAVLVLELDPSGVVRVAAGLERLLGEPGAFLRPRELETLFSGAGLPGQVVRRSRLTYTFLGIRRKASPSPPPGDRRGAWA